ncbi:MAG: DUF192 domain-containing protein [Actinomycetota bacterium]|nr:DUF192 domain-containing protein [Actinomycetota bacterium]
MPGAIVVEPSERILARDVSWARTGAQRVTGLRGRDDLGAGSALVLEPAKQVHTFGMRFPIDVVFCDSSGKVKHVVEQMSPRRVSRVVLTARYAIEMRGGSLRGVVKVGDRLRFED